jgi:hypothetical protein
MSNHHHCQSHRNRQHFNPTSKQWAATEQYLHRTKMKHTFPIALLTMAFTLAGCSALEQAPLVYSSKTTLGVDIGSTSTESPGISLNLGFKMIDAAYVPVAVAKKCETKAESSDCSNEIYKLQIIGGDGSAEDGKTPELTSEEKIDAHKKVADYEDARKELTQMEKELSSAKGSIDKKEKAVKALTQKVIDNKNTTDGEIKLLNEQISNLQLKPTTERSTAETEELQSLQNDVKNKQAASNQFIADTEKQISILKTDLSVAKRKNTRLATDINSKKAQVTDLVPEAKKAQQVLSITNRKDSYSVYGKFESNSSVETSKGVIGLGKIFSTGVASQHLTSGLAKYYSSLGFVACIEGVAKIDKSKLAAGTIDLLLRECANPSLD